MLARASACALALLVAGCFLDAGLPNDSAPATTAASSADATTTASTTDVATTTPGATSTSTAASTTATTAAPLCAAAGEQCDGPDACCGCLSCTDGKCVASPDVCGTCRTCADDGTCAFASPGDACDPGDDKCMDTIWGVDGKDCLARDETGQCDPSGLCISTGCDAKGEAIATCKSPACVDASTCAPGNPVGAVTNFCIEQGPTPDCKTECVDTLAQSVLTIRQCGPGGDCLAQPMACGVYKCDGASACKVSCEFDGDCIPLHICDGFGECVLR